MFEIALNDELRFQEGNSISGYDIDDTYLMDLYKAYVDVFVTNAKDIDEAFREKEIADDFKEQVKELRRMNSHRKERM